MTTSGDIKLDQFLDDCNPGWEYPKSTKEGYPKPLEEKPFPDNVLVDEPICTQYWWWLKYFQENLEYKTYCEAMRDKNYAQCTQLYPDPTTPIHQLYKDWGDIHVSRACWENGLDWMAWLYERRHNFNVVNPVIRDVTSKVDKGYVGIQYSAGITKETALRLFKWYLDSKSDSEVLGNAPPLRYKFHLSNGKIPENIFKAVKRAYAIYHMAAGLDDTEAVFAIKEMDSKQAFELVNNDPESKNGNKATWEYDEELVNRHKNGTGKKIELKEWIRDIQHYKRMYEVYVANTINGVFPKS